MKIQVMSMKVDPRNSEHKSDIIKFKLEIIHLFQNNSINNSISHLKLDTGTKSQVMKECLPVGRGLQDAQCPNEDQLSPWIPPWELLVTAFLEMVYGARVQLPCHWMSKCTNYRLHPEAKLSTSLQSQNVGINNYVFADMSKRWWILPESQKRTP